MLNLLSITIQNFLSFGEAQTVSLDGQGLVFVEGHNADDHRAASNGAGKSAILEALIWCLFGKTIRPYKGDDVINTRAKRDCFVELLGDQDGKEWAIKRARKTGGRENDLRFTYGKNDLSALKDMDATQNKIERTLSLDYDIFVNSIVFGQGNKFRFMDSSDADRKAFLDRVLGLELLEAAKKVVASEARGAQYSLNALDTEVEHLTALITSDETSIKGAEEAFKQQKKGQIGALKAKRARLDEELATFEKRIAELAIDDNKIATLEKLVDDGKTRRTEIATEISGYKQARAKLEAVMEGAAEVIKKTEKKIAKLQDYKIGGDCPICGNEITKEGRQIQIGKYEVEIKAEGKKLKTAQDEITVIADETAVAEKHLRKQDKEAEEANREREALNMDRARALDLNNRVHGLKKDKKQIAADIEKVEAQQSPLIDDALVRVEKNKKRAVEAEKKRAEVTQEIEYLEFWEVAFGNGGIRSFLLDYVVPTLNKKAEKYAKHLMSGLVVEFNTQSQLKSGEIRDKLEIAVTNSWGADAYQGSSGGERRRVDIVVARALQDLVSDRSNFKCNLSFYDEVFESLDESACDAVVAMLQDEAKTKSSVFVISHQDWLKAGFSRILRVEKNKGFSTAGYVG